MSLAIRATDTSIGLQDHNFVFVIAEFECLAMLVAVKSGATCPARSWADMAFTLAASAARTAGETGGGGWADPAKAKAIIETTVRISFIT